MAQTGLVPREFDDPPAPFHGNPDTADVLIGQRDPGRFCETVHSLDLSFGSGSEKDAITFVPKAVDFMNVIGKLPGTTFHGNSKLFGNGIRCQDD